MKEAIRRVTGEETEPIGASRTDSGAHARGQVAHLDLTVPIPADRLKKALNRLLPFDLKIVEVTEVDETFNSRFSASFRHYQYRILHDTSDPFGGRFAHGFDRKLDLDKMQEAASYLVGEHDFEAFTEELDDSVENTVRTLFRIDVTQQHPYTLIDIEGTAFLRGMMRRISGFLVEVGRGHRPGSDAPILLSDQRESLEGSVVLPAKGLTLMRVHYDFPYRNHRLKLGQE